MHTTISNKKRNTRRSRVTQEQQSNQLAFERKTINDQASKIAEQSKRIEEFIKQQGDKNKND